MCNEPSLPVISVSLHMSVITQRGHSPLMLAARWGETEVVSLLVKAGAALDLQNKVNMCHHSVMLCVRWSDGLKQMKDVGMAVAFTIPMLLQD